MSSGLTDSVLQFLIYSSLLFICSSPYFFSFLPHLLYWSLFSLHKLHSPCPCPSTSLLHLSVEWLLSLKQDVSSTGNERSLRDKRNTTMGGFTVSSKECRVRPELYSGGTKRWYSRCMGYKTHLFKQTLWVTNSGWKTITNKTSIPIIDCLRPYVLYIQ